MSRTTGINQKQARKKYAKHGESKSKMISFRCDEIALKVLSKQDNKGRFINNAILWYYSEKNIQCKLNSVNFGMKPIKIKGKRD